MCHFRPSPVRTFTVAATTTIGNGLATAARYGVIPLSMSRTMSQVASPTTSKSSRPLLRAVSALVVGTLALGSGLLTLAEFQHRRAQRANDTATRQTPATETELRRMFIDADPTFAFQHRSTYAGRMR